MIAYHGKQEVKDLYLNRVEEHRKADQLIQGYGYWEDGKGCAVGCTLHSGKHSSYESKLGIPQILAHLEEHIFEKLPKENARLWPEQFLAAIRPGADLSMIWPKFAVWLLVDPEHGVVKFAKNAAPVQAVADLYQRRTDGDEPSVQEWESARRAAAAAYDDAAYAAADAAADAAYAAYAADDAYAAYAAADAAYAADADADYAAAAAYAAAADAADAYAADAYAAYAYAYADADARQAAVIRQSEKLLELLRAA